MSPTAIIEEEKTAYEQALEALEAAKQQLPTYESSYDQQAEALYQQLLNRPKFTYDSGADALYQTYKQSYAQQGRLAMQHTMGQAAGLTGGYGSSYSQSVGQQQYNAYLQKLSEIFPETYAMAYQQYQGEGAELQNRYGMVQDLAEQEYNMYQDKLSAYYQQLSQLQERADVEYDRQVAAEQTAYDRQQDEYQKQQDAYDRLSEMMLTLGYVPTAEELQAAGMSDSAMQAYRNYYVASTASSGGGGGGRSSSKKSSTGSALAQARAALAATGDIEQVNGGVAQKVARGEISVETGRSIITTLTKEYFS